jgi:hypothetical protein
VTNAQPFLLKAMSNGRTHSRRVPHAGSTTNCLAAVGSPPGYFVTMPLAQLAIQMLPFRSDTVPCGQSMAPLV